jgi:hypothetical protein
MTLTPFARNPLQRSAEQSLGGGEFSEWRRCGVAAVLQVQVAPLVEFHLNGVDHVVAAEPPDRPPAGEPVVHPDIEPGSAQRSRHQPDRRRRRRRAVPVAEDHVPVEADAEAVQVE